MKMKMKELCKFSKICKGYRKEAFTCHDTEAEWYCGYYRRFEEIMRIKNE